MKQPRNPIRLGHAARIRCTPFDLSRAMNTPPTKVSVQTPTQSSMTAILSSRNQELKGGYYVKVQESIVMVPKSLFDQIPPEIRNSLFFSNGNGLSFHEPIHLHGPTVLQLRHLIHAFTNYPNLDIHNIPLDQLFNIAELACQYGLANIKSWVLRGVEAVLNRGDTPLRTGPNELFIRALRIATSYNYLPLRNSIEAKWITRLYWNQLSPLPALLEADKLGLPNLQRNSYYLHMVERATMGDIVEYCRQSPSSSSPLSHEQRTHLLEGYYSFAAYWKKTSLSPPDFMPSPECVGHAQCLAAWRMRWVMACSQPSLTPEVDVLKRLVGVETVLKGDEVLMACLDGACRMSALASISRKRTEVSRSLHHHFDLD